MKSETDELELGKQSSLKNLNEDKQGKAYLL